jgi:hypothetical protein
MTKHFIFILLSALSFCGWTQDTLFLLNGEVKVVQINKVDNTNELLYYSVDAKIFVRNLNTIARYTQSGHIENSSIQANLPTAEGSFIDAGKRVFKEKALYTEYSFNKFSLGFNLLSPLSAIELSTIAYNLNLSFYGQYDFDESRGIRLPVRVGFNAFSGKSSRYPYNRSSFNHRDILFEIGAEYIENVKENYHRTHNYHLIGVYGSSVTNISYTTLYNNNTYTDFYIASSPRACFRIAYNHGIQFNISRNIQINLEGGINLNNMKNTYSRVSLGVQGAVNVVHRLGAKSIE